jgi:hypothetical protein
VAIRRTAHDQGLSGFGSGGVSIDLSIFCISATVRVGIPGEPFVLPRSGDLRL